MTGGDGGLETPTDGRLQLLNELNTSQTWTIYNMIYSDENIIIIIIINIIVDFAHKNIQNQNYQRRRTSRNLAKVILTFDQNRNRFVFQVQYLFQLLFKSFQQFTSLEFTTFPWSSRCDLDLWSMTLKTQSVHPRTGTYLCVKFGDDCCSILTCRTWTYKRTMRQTLRL